MPQTALQLAATVAARARDPEQTGTTQATYFEFLSRAQTIVNAGLESVVYSVTFTILPRQQVYSVDGDVGLACDAVNQPRPVRVIGIRDAGRDLDEVEFKTLAHLNREWWTESGDELRSFARFGHDIIIVRPMLRAARSVSVIYVGQTPILNVPDSATVIPDEDTDMLLDLVEMMARIKGRDFAEMKPLFERFTTRMKATAEEVR